MYVYVQHISSSVRHTFSVHSFVLSAVKIKMNERTNEWTFGRQCQAVIGQHEKRQRQFDRLVDEWKRKVADLQTELDNSQKESRANAADAYKLKAQLDENRETIDAVRRENKNLSGYLFI